MLIMCIKLSYYLTKVQNAHIFSIIPNKIHSELYTLGTCQGRPLSHMDRSNFAREDPIRFSVGKILGRIWVGNHNGLKFRQIEYNEILFWSNDQVHGFFLEKNTAKSAKLWHFQRSILSPMEMSIGYISQFIKLIFRKFLRRRWPICHHFRPLNEY